MVRRVTRGQITMIETMMIETKLPKIARIVMGDPAGKIIPYPDGTNIKHDYFGWIGVESRYPYRRVNVLLAKRWKDVPFSKVANWAKRIHDTIHPGFMGLETNNMGGDILKLFQTKHDMPYLKGVYTSGNMTDDSRKKWSHMDKRFMSKWYKKNQNDVFFPKNGGEEFRELLYQISIIRESTMRADLGRHDDLFMPLILCLNVVRLLREEVESQTHG